MVRRCISLSRKTEKGFGNNRVPAPPRWVVSHLKHGTLFTVQKSGIFYVERPAGTKKDVLYLWRFFDQKTIKLHTFEKEFFFGLDVSSDEKTVFFSQYDVNNADIMLIDEFR